MSPSIAQPAAPSTPEVQTLTQTLAAHWAGMTCADLPTAVIARAQRAVHDTVAAGIAGIGSPEHESVSRGMAALHRSGQGASTLWGQDWCLPPAQAALVNGTLAHARELDDFNGCGHSGAVIVPTVCAVADAVGADGGTVVTAIAAGYDVAARLLEASGGYRVHNARGWHSTVTCGSFGAAAAAARVLGLPAERFTAALGIAGSCVGGVWAFMADGAMTKRLHPGKAAENGVTAAFLAEAGMTGPTAILEAAWGGFFATYCGDTARPERLTDGLGRRQWILDAGIKPYACCRGSHAGLDALFVLMQTEAFGAGDIESIVIRGAEPNVRLVGNKRIDNVLDAQMSLPYALAVAACGGDAALTRFDPLRTGDPEVARLLRNTEMVVDARLGENANAVVQVLLKDGRRFEHQVLRAKGDPQNPLTDDEFAAKTRSLIEPVLGVERVAQIAEALSRLDRVDDFRAVSQLLRGPMLRPAAARAI